MNYSLQSRLSRRQAGLKRKLIDNNLNNAGYSNKILVIDIDENKYLDEEITFNRFDYVTGWISFPNNKIPIFTTEGYEKGINIYDLLPIKAYFKHSDNIKKGDILIFKYLLTLDTLEYKLIVLQVVEQVGSFSNVLLFSEYTVAPTTLDIEAFPAIKNEIDNWATGDIE